MVRTSRVPGYMFLPIALVAWSLGHSSTVASAQGAVNTEPDSSDGLVRLDIAVTDKSGSPVTGLKPGDFTLLDNGQPQKLVSFRAHDESSDEPVEIILLIDALNLTSLQVADAEKEAEKFLRENQGHLAHPVMVYRLTDDGLTASQQPSTDGNALADEVARGSEPRVVWLRPHSSYVPLNVDLAGDRNEKSLKALGAIAIEGKWRPGRKLLIWISPGWPTRLVDGHWHDEIVEMNTRLREARIHLFSVTAWRYPEKVSDAKEVEADELALDVLASKSGGSATDPSFKIKETIDKCVNHAGDYYTVTFDPPRAATVDEIHELQVTVDKPDLSARTNSEYYDQPTFYDEPAPPREQVTVEKLQQFLESLRSLSDSGAARHLSELELTERLSRTKIETMKSLLHGQKAKEALIALADRSAFLPPPAAEIPSDAAPSIHDQRLMIDEMIQYLHNTIPTVPNLFATRTTVRYEEPAQKENQTWKTAAPDQTLHPAATESVTVLVRNSKETSEAAPQRSKHNSRKGPSLMTEGTFGPMLAMTVMVDIAGPHSQITWSRWELDPEGQRAVFRYTVPRESSHFETRSCCLADPDGTVPFNTISAYHGEIAIDPKTGAVLRVTAQADFLPRLPEDRSDVMVEYGPVKIGDKTYICPVHSVSISRSRTVRILLQWNMRFGVYGPFETLLNDVTFSDYHIFRSEHRILTDAPSAP